MNGRDDIVYEYVKLMIIDECYHFMCIWFMFGYCMIDYVCILDKLEMLSSGRLFEVFHCLEDG